MPPVLTEYVAFRGGLNQIQAQIASAQGSCLDALNFEVVQFGQGYRRIKGYERYDGHTQPHTATYYILPVTITGSVSAGDTITGATSGATGVVLAVAPTYLVFTKLAVSSFVDGEDLNVLGSPEATTTDTAASFGASTAALDATYKNLAADEYRDDIAAPTGSGPVRGVWIYGGNVYCFRDSGAACVMYKATASGWSAVSLGEEVSYTVGSGSLDVGDTLTQGGVTATIRAITVESGTIGAGTAAGRLILSGRAGGNYAAGAATSTGGGTATLSGAQSAISLTAGGRFEFVNHAFVTTEKMYGCNGIDRVFEFDGTTFVPIASGFSAVKYVAVHANHLLVAAGTSLGNSALGDPYNWQTTNDAGEYVAGATITGLVSQPGDATNAATAVFTRNVTKVFYGTSSADFVLQTFQEGIGGIDRTAQSIGTAYALDDMGVSQVGASQSFGNFSQATVSQQFFPFLNERLSLATASAVNRAKNQYLIFFSDGYGLSMTFAGRKVLGALPLYFPDPVACICTGTVDGVEATFFGSTDGMVYRLGVGTSMDGDPMDFSIRIPYQSSKSPRVSKRYRRAVLDAKVDSYLAMNAVAQLSYSSTEPISPSAQSISAGDVVQTWDNGYWDVGYWDAGEVPPVEFELTGSGESLSLTFYGTSDEIDEFTLNGVIVHYTPQRGLR